MTVVPPHWRRPLILLALLCAAIAALFARDIAHMVSIWWGSSTYNHILFIPPLIAWLIAQRIALVAPLRAVAWWPGAALMLAAGFVWFAGEVTDIALLRHLGVVLMLGAAVATALGPMLVRALAFPLAYGLLLVPFGDELVPLFQEITAHMSMVLLALFSIPATLDGLFITTPSGVFIVAEACSGVMFLVAMAAFAILAAHLCFSSWKRRIIFVTSALLTTIIANALRAFGTILIAEHFGHEYAVGMDHLIYGWVFFAVIITAVMLVARRWFDRPANDIAVDMRGLDCAVLRTGKAVPVGLAAALALVLAAVGGHAAAGGLREVADRALETR